MRVVTLFCFLAALPPPMTAVHAAGEQAGQVVHGAQGVRGGTGKAAPSPYAGREKRAIKTLSPKDIDDLRNGRGWGLAKAAELNGVPGPSHLLELKREIPLSAEQIRAVEKMFAGMKARAIPLGKQLVALERALNESFARRDIDRDRLKARVDAIAQVRAALRPVHLETHLLTPAILTHRQITAYNRLRGYDIGPMPGAIPGSVPEGHGGHH